MTVGLNGWKKSLIVTTSTIKKFWKPKYLLHFKIPKYISKMPQVGSNYTCSNISWICS